LTGKVWFRKFAAKQLTLHSFMKKAGFVIFLIIILAGCNNLTKVLKSSDVDYKYRKACEYYDKKKYGSAQQIFENIFPFLKGRKEFEDAFYKFAYSYYYLGDYFNAENLFRQFAEVFPGSAKVTEMEYMRAYTYYKQSPKVELEQTNTVKAIGMMRQFITRFPNSEQAKQAQEIIRKCQQKLEDKEVMTANLYYRMGHYKAASVSYNSVMANYPESEKADMYRYLAIKSFYQYANLSIADRQEERYEQVVNDCNDFTDKFPESKYLKDIERLVEQCKNNIKNIKNEQAKKTFVG
jgi:outer membrane protein assembly factor BamD